MNTEVILYKQQLAINENFNLVPEYGWTFNGSNGVEWDKEDQKIIKLTGTSGSLYQSGILVPGVLYRVRFNVSGRTTSSAAFKCDASGATHVAIGLDGLYDVTFYADGTDILFETTNTFDGAFSKFSITEYPNTFSLDLYNDVSIPLNFSIDDLFELGKRKTTFSKTIQIPGTKNNNIAFNHVYKINSEDLYVPTKLSGVVILNSGIQVFSGSLSIDNITKVIRDGIEEIEYNVTVFGNLVDIFDKLGNKTIKDLDFARYDHTFDIETILRSSGTSWTVGGLQEINDNSTSPSTFIDNQTVSYSKVANSIGSYSYGGYARVEINFSTAHSFAIGDDVTLVSENHLLSGEQTVVYIYGNNIVLNMLWSNLVTTSITNLVVQKRTWHSKGYYYPMIDSGSWMRECINGDIAPSNTNTAGQLTQGKLYTVKYLVPDDDFSNIAKDPVTGSAMTVVEGCTFLAVQTGSYFPNTPTTPTIWANGTILLTHDLEVNGAKLYYKKLFANHWFPTDFIPHIYVKEVWDKMMQLINYYYTGDALTNNLFTRLIMPVDQSFNIYEFIGQDASPYVNPLDAQYVYMNDWLPQMPLKDFMISILNLFNLVIIQDGEQENLIHLVSRSDFFNATEINLTPDTSLPIEIKLSNTFLPKGYQIKYKDSEDFFNKDYNTDFGNISNTNGIINTVNRKYGDLYEDTGNQNKTDVKTTELSFVPTVLAGNITGVYDTFNVLYGQDKVFSTAFDADVFGNNAKRNISNRILIAGLRGTHYPYSLQASVADVPNSMADVYDQYYGYVTRWFPYAGHIDNVFNAVPTYDLNFGTLLGQYFPQTYNATEWQNKTIGGIYWGKYLLDITNVNGKIITGTFKFSITDIYNLDFRNVYRLNTYSLKLGKITDWDVNGDGFAKCEFTLKNI